MSQALDEGREIKEEKVLSSNVHTLFQEAGSVEGR